MDTKNLSLSLTLNRTENSGFQTSDLDFFTLCMNHYRFSQEAINVAAKAWGLQCLRYEISELQIIFCVDSYFFMFEIIQSL